MLFERKRKKSILRNSFTKPTKKIRKTNKIQPSKRGNRKHNKGNRAREIPIKLKMVYI